MIRTPLRKKTRSNCCYLNIFQIQTFMKKDLKNYLLTFCKREKANEWIEVRCPYFSSRKKNSRDTKYGNEFYFALVDYCKMRSCHLSYL